MTPLLAPRLGRSPEASFERLYRKHVRDVYGFAYGVLGNRPDAEDVTQSTFLNAYRAFMRGDEIENMRAWLLAIAQNVCRQRFRTSSRRPKEVELNHEIAETFVEDDAPTAGEIRAAMEELAFNQRVVLVLREIEGLSYEDIAETMGITLSAVETLLFRARRALREQLEAADNAVSCDAVERLISLQLDGKLSRQDKGLLRAHLRTCAECARLARSQRARKRVMSGLGAAPLPAGLANWWQPLGAGIGAKVATAVGAAIITGGALVTTGVLPTPASERRDAAIRVLDERATEVGSLTTAALREASGNPRFERPAGARNGSTARRLKVNKKGSLRLVAAKRARPTGANSTSGGGTSSVPALPPVATVGGAGSTVGGVGSTVGGVGSSVGGVGSSVGGVASSVDGAVSGVIEDVAEATSKVPRPPVSPSLEPPSLPTVTLPDLGGTVPLP